MEVTKEGINKRSKTCICRGSISQIERQEHTMADYEFWTLDEVFGVPFVPCAKLKANKIVRAVLSRCRTVFACKNENIW